jgi:hypothetical protein
MKPWLVFSLLSLSLVICKLLFNDDRLFAQTILDNGQGIFSRQTPTTNKTSFPLSLSFFFHGYEICNSIKIVISQWQQRRSISQQQETQRSGHQNVT